MSRKLIAILMLVAMLLSTVAGVGPATAATGDPVLINEVFASHAGTDDTEYVEFYGIPGTSLDGLSLIVVESDAGSSQGNIDRRLDFGPIDIMGSNGFFLVGNPAGLAANYGVAPNINIADNYLENSSMTVALVETSSISGSSVAGGETVLDTVALTDGGAGDVFYFSAPVIGPDGTYFPAGARRVTDGVDTDTAADWVISDFSLGSDNTPTAGDVTPPPPPPPPEVAISEIRIDQPSADNDEYFELVGAAGTALDGLAYLVIGDGSGGSGVIENVTDLTGQVIPGSGYFVVAESTFTLGTADLTTSLNFENSDNVTHLLVSSFTGSTGQDLDTDDDGTLDSTPWSEVVDCVGLVETPGSGELLYCGTLVGPDGSFVPGHVYLCDDGWRIGEFGIGVTDSPGAANPCDVLFTGDCGDPATLISAVQGEGLVSPLVGTQVVIEGIVVGDFQWGGSDNGDLGGFFVQEEDADADGNPLTSEGVLVFDSGFGVDVAVGDRVRVNGVVSEFFDKTEIGSVSDVLICDSGNSVTPAGVTLPVGSVDDLEAYEGMAVVFSQPLYISEFFNFDRYGEIVLTTNRQFQPTAIHEPGSPEAAQLAQENLLSRIRLDDGRTSQNPDPALHPNGGNFNLSNLFRGGDELENVTGVLDYDFGLYRIQPTQGADYAAANPRSVAPEEVGGSLKVAAFNVLNYFTTIDNNGPICGPLQDQGCRGADTPEEFTRQRDKIITALAAMDADVVGLIEIENYPGDVPTADLVSGLNAVMGAGTYDYIATGAIGTDAIRQAFIYKPATVSALGDFAVLDDPSFTDPLGYGEQKSRPALAQTLMDKSTCGVFTVVVNHLKSKGSACGPGDDDPEQGNCNLTRTLGAQALVDWLATHPTGSGDSDFLIIGDLNAYDKEDPIDAVKAGPDDVPATDDDYSDLIYHFQGEYAYSYVFDGQLGYLDHALANASLQEKVIGTTVWHINADEPDLIDYDMTYKQDAQDAIYAPDAYRSSDHDPVIVGITDDDSDVTAPELQVSVSPDMLWPPNHKYVEVVATVVATDNFDPNPTVTLVSVTSNEPDNGLGDGDTPDDIVIVDDFTFQLRAERAGGGEGRVYTITYLATDACGNSTMATATVTVPHSMDAKGDGSKQRAQPLRPRP
jgi:predicted extracellular nuclease